MLFRLLALAALLGIGAAASAAAPPARIISLAPSITEDLFAIGAGPRVVGVSEATDYPAAAKRLPVVATFASIDTEKIVALHPDVAFGIAPQARLVTDLRRANLRTVLVHDDSYASIFDTLRTLGTQTGRSAQAASLIASLRARTGALVRGVPKRARKPSVFVVLGTAPIFTVGRGSYIDTLIAMAGGANAAADIGAPYARYSAEALLARQPDVLVVDPSIHFRDAVGQEPWRSLRAVRAHRVAVLPDAAILERPGPRYNDGLAWLIAALRAR